MIFVLKTVLILNYLPMFRCLLVCVTYIYVMHNVVLSLYFLNYFFIKIKWIIVCEEYWFQFTYFLFDLFRWWAVVFWPQRLYNTSFNCGSNDNWVSNYLCVLVSYERLFQKYLRYFDWKHIKIHVYFILLFQV